MFVAVSVRSVRDRRLQVTTHGTFEYLVHVLDLQVAYALWQPTLALAGKTRSHLVYQYRVERSGTPGLYAEVLFGVDVVVVK